MLLAIALSAVFVISSDRAALQLSSSEDLMKRLVVLPGLLALAVFVLATAVASQRAEASSTSPAIAPVSTTGPAQSFGAQVVGVEWLNPLQRRDYPTEWQLLWTLGLVKPNRNDDMVKVDAKKFTTLQPVASIADANGGRESLDGYYEKYIDQLLVLFGDPYVMNAKYFYSVKAQDRRKWRELAGMHVEFAIPSGRLDPAEAGQYLRKGIISEFNIGNDEFTDLWSRNTPPDVRVTSGGPNAGFTSLNAALDYLQAHPQQSVWVMNWDAPSYPPKFRQINENLVLLILAGPELKTEREPLAWIGRAATGNVKDFEAKAGTTRAVQAWKSTIEVAAQNAGRNLDDIQYIIHDAGKGSDSASERVGSLSRTLTENLPEFDYQKQTFNTAGLLGDMGAGSALTNVALAIARANHLGGSVLVAGTTDPDHPVAVVVSPPSKLTPIVADQDWFRARGENNAYLPWWGRRHDTDYKQQGYSY
ncbi:virulence factor [Paraburkholderia fungorum]|uniref:Virulence factor n=2 Tax=Paraburkholderia fungorum TaxID=134537 RepID=A0A3R7L8L8_9BURK|nr:virulence factor [Paraburkholderia fungorum]